MSMLKEKFKGTYFISFISITTAICEFGISSIFILFLLYILNFSHPLASETYAYYYGIAYLFPIFIGDAFIYLFRAFILIILCLKGLISEYLSKCG